MALKILVRENADRLPTAAILKDYLHVARAHTWPHSTDGVRSWRLGMAAPLAALSAATSAGGNKSGAYEYGYTHLDDKRGSAGPMGPVAEITLSNQHAHLSQLAGDPTNRGTRIRIYRKEPADPEHRIICTSAYADLSAGWVDTLADGAGGAIYVNPGTPPAYGLMAAWQSHLWMAGDDPLTLSAAVTSGASAVPVSGAPLSSWAVGKYAHFYPWGTVEPEYAYTYRINGVQARDEFSLSFLNDPDTPVGWQDGTLSSLGVRIVGDGSRLRWSAAADCDSWPAGHFIDIDPDRGEGITALLPFPVGRQEYMVVAKDRSLYLIYPTTLAYTWRRVPGERGAAGPFCLAMVDGARVYGFDGSGVWEYVPGADAPREVGAALRSLIPGDSRQGLHALNTDRLYFASLAWNPLSRYLRLCVASAGSSYNDLAFRYYPDTEGGEWWPDSRGGEAQVYDWTAFEFMVGDRHGFPRVFDRTDRMGATSGTLSGTATSGHDDWIADGGASFRMDGEGLKGAMIALVKGRGEGQVREIDRNSATHIWPTAGFTTDPDATTEYVIGGKHARARFAELSPANGRAVRISKVRVHGRAEG